MLSISYMIVLGDGTLPKDLRLGSFIRTTAVGYTIGYFSWELLTKPSSSTCFIEAPSSPSTKIGPFDITGTYTLKLTNIDFSGKELTKILSINALDSHSATPNPPMPEFLGGNDVKNYGFTVPGTNPGEAKDWNTVDPNGLLATPHAGVSIGRIEPQHYNPPTGTYVFCVGDDVQNALTFAVGTSFEINQEVDFTNVSIMHINLKFTNNS